MFDRKNGAPEPLATLTYGATAARLKANGHRPVSAIAPDGCLALWPVVQFVAHEAPLISEHPVAVRTAALALSPIEDDELDKRVRAALAKRGLLAGPTRLGSDGVELRPINLSGSTRGVLAELDGRVILHELVALPFDGQWSASLLDVPASQLPAIAADDVSALFAEELRYLESRLRHERAPKPRPSKTAWVDAS